MRRVHRSRPILAGLLTGALLLLLVGVLVLLWIEEPRVGAVVTLFVLISRTANLAVPRVTAEREVFAQYYGLVEERLAGVDDIRPNGGGD